jgi:anti-sigma-K factor RskA
MKLAHPELIEHLASHYVLGTLSPRARRRFESLLPRRADLRAAVQRWNTRLNLVGAAAAPWTADTHTPAPAREARSRRMWQAIAAQTQAPLVPVPVPVAPRAPAAATHAPPRARAHSAGSDSTRWFRPSAWAGLFGGAFAGAACAVLVMMARPDWVTSTDRVAMRIDERLPQSYVGLLTDDQGQGRALLSSLRHGKTVTVKMLGTPLPALPAGERYVLWALPTDARPFAVATVPDKGSATAQLPDTSEKLFGKVSKLVVTIETSATADAPGARVALKGNCAKLW